MTKSNIWDQIESYQALQEFGKTHHQEDLWDGIHPLCEALGTELRAFAEAHPEHELESLVMANDTAFRQPFSHEFLKSLAASGVFRTLQALDLTDTELDAEGLVILSQAEGWEQLQHLGLNCCHIQQAGAEALSRCLPASLKMLDLSQCGFTEEQPWTELLASSPALANVEELVLSKNRASYAQCQQLANSPYIKTNQTADEWYVH